MIRKYPAAFAGLFAALCTGAVGICGAVGVSHDLVGALSGMVVGLNLALGALVHAVVTPTSQVALTHDDVATLTQTQPTTEGN